MSAQGLEGVVAKKKDSVYEQGQRSDYWINVKNLRTCDCVVFAYTKGQGVSFASAIVGLYSDQEPVFVANVNAWVKPAVVCEVVYQSVSSGCKLRFPRFHRVRLDKAPSECTIDQIAGKGIHFNQQMA